MLLLVFFTFILRLCLFRCSPRSGKGEGLRPAPGQLLIVWQQPVHQSQRQRRVGVRRRFRLQLGVWGGGAAQQEEAACGGHLESWAGKTWPRSRRRGTREGERVRGLQSSRGSPPPPPFMPTTPAPLLPRRPPQSLPSISGWARSGDSWPLKPPHTAATIVSLPTQSQWTGGRKSAGWKMTASIHQESFRSPPPHPSLSLFFGSPSLVFPL